MESYKMNNTSKRKTKNEIECVRTVSHGGNAWHRPLRNITSEQSSIIKRCSNHSITKIQHQEKRDKEQIHKRKKKIRNNILLWYTCSLLDTKMENYKEQYTNKNKETKELKLKWLRTAFHVGYTGHRPLRKITIERWCFIKRCSNHSITRIQQRKKRDKEQIPKGKRKLEIILVIYSLL